MARKILARCVCGLPLYDERWKHVDAFAVRHGEPPWGLRLTIEGIELAGKSRDEQKDLIADRVTAWVRSMHRIAPRPRASSYPGATFWGQDVGEYECDRCFPRASLPGYEL
jgi:hypothetical protein